MFFDIITVLIPREVINPIPDFTKYYFGYEDLIFILSRLPKLKDISKMIYLSPFLIYLYLLTLWQPKYFMFTGVKISSHNVFRVKQPW